MKFDFFSENFWMEMSKRYRLTPQLLRVAILGCQAGMETKDIYEKLEIKESTLKVHRRLLYARLCVKNKFQMLWLFIQESTKMVAIVIILLCCSVSFASRSLNNNCIVNWKDFPKDCDLKVYSVFANNWLKEDRNCVMRSYQRQYQELRKKISQVEPHLYHPPIEVNE